MPASGKSLTRSAGYRAYFGRVSHNGKDIDEAVCLVFRAPHSYTGEDVAEISLHGGLFVMQKALKAVIEAGARPAELASSQSAFLNGKLDCPARRQSCRLFPHRTSRRHRLPLARRLFKPRDKVRSGDIIAVA